MREICLEVKPFLQPEPTKNPGGDCFACTVTAILQHLFPDDPPTFDECFGYWYHTDTDGSKHLSNTWIGCQDAILNALRDENHNYRIEYMVDFVLPDFQPEKFSYDHYHFIPERKWAQRLEAWLSAGWIAISEIDMEGKGPQSPDGYINSTNHFVCIDGIKYQWTPNKHGNGASLDYLIHVVCSRKGAYWIDALDLLKNYGSAGLWLIRKDLNRYEQV
jgi:hypothetical protein